jgi:thymidylate kinase
MRADFGQGRIRFVSFSGIDGAGKSTQIRRLRSAIEQAGLRCSVVSFWDDVARFKKLREGASHSIFKSECGVGTPEAPVARRDKNVRSLPMTALRLCIYLVDAVSTRMVMRRLSRCEADVVILDRFIYDELANLNLENPLMRAYARAMAKFVPQLEISFLIDAEPAEARARKPEYPLDFLHFSRKSYLQLSELIGCISVIAPGRTDEVGQEILNCAAMALSVGSNWDKIDRGEHLVESA